MHISDEIHDLKSTLDDLKSDGTVTPGAMQDITEHLTKIQNEADDLETYKMALMDIADEFDCCETASAADIADAAETHAQQTREALDRIGSALMRSGTLTHNRAADLDLVDVADMVETGVLFIPRGQQ